MLKQILLFSVNYRKIILAISPGFLLVRNGIAALVLFADLWVTSERVEPGYWLSVTGISEHEILVGLFSLPCASQVLLQASWKEQLPLFRKVEENVLTSFLSEE